MANRKERKIAQKVKKGNQYISYYNAMTKAGKQPMTKYHWDKTRRSGYYGTKGSVESTSKLPRKLRKMAGLPD